MTIVVFAQLSSDALGPGVRDLNEDVAMFVADDHEQDCEEGCRRERAPKRAASRVYPSGTWKHRGFA
jgi:hypothetical protein